MIIKIRIIYIELILFYVIFYFYSEKLTTYPKQAFFEHRLLTARCNLATERAPSREYLRTSASRKNSSAKTTLESSAAEQDARWRGIQTIITTERRDDDRTSKRRRCAKGRTGDSATKSSVFHKAQGYPRTSETTSNHYYPKKSCSLRLGV